MADAVASRYWCHMCRQVVDPLMEMELKCPFCDSGFVEEIDEGETPENEEVGSEQPFSPWASILLGMMANPSRRRRLSRRIARIEDDEYSDLERELESILWRRNQRELEDEDRRTRMEEDDDELDGEHEPHSITRRRQQSTARLQLLYSLREDFRSESDEPERGRERDRDRERERERERESLVLVNPFSQAVLLEGSLDTDQNQGGNLDSSSFDASIGDYFISSGLDLLLQHLAENDPNRYGTPPARKEAVDAIPTVKNMENMSCPVCLEDLEVGMEARKMPCKHKFHGACIFPWLELHSTCPVCRFQLPTDEQKASNGSTGANREGGRRTRSQASASWPFSSLFSFSGSQSDDDSSSMPTSAASASERNPPADEN
ncbi:E3 ubiquitin-protein ligase RING1-like [Apostasia shenzhenica]|uniref:RING-type E3 ubiquitin transferase n=1 Tax=Apostasia shenzhenica TaxID=1088818 RepID=A0A2I0A6K8_9ASPA|nr:E3 ubiquitin-protein ligase RING1-like [Apostasia shenzhenica]